MWSRRRFLACAVALPGVPLACVDPSAGRTARHCLLNRFSIAGMRPAALAHLRRQPCPLRPGDRLTLAVDARNPFDPYTVAIHFNDIHLGEVPRSDSRAISRLLRQGVPLSCHVAAVDPAEAAWNAVQVEVGVVIGGG